MKRLITLSIVVALLPTLALAHQNLGTTIISVEPSTVLPGETIVVEFEYTVVNYDPPHYEVSPWRIRLDGIDPYTGILLSSGSNSHNIGNGTELTFNVVRTVTIPSTTEPGSHDIRVWTSSEFAWGTRISSDTALIEVASPVQEVDIDIKPGSKPNTINLASNGVIPVAILSSADFDALTVDPATVQLQGKAGVRVKGNGNPLAIERDVNGDGYVDLELKIEVENLEPGDIQDGIAEITGSTTEGQDFVGTDSVTIVPL